MGEWGVVFVEDLLDENQKMLICFIENKCAYFMKNLNLIKKKNIFVSKKISSRSTSFIDHLKWLILCFLILYSGETVLSFFNQNFFRTSLSFVDQPAWACSCDLNDDLPGGLAFMCSHFVTIHVFVWWLFCLAKILHATSTVKLHWKLL